MHPIFKIEIDENDKELCFDFNSTVDFPAHVRAFEKYSAEEKRSFFYQQEKMRITGVLIAANVPIYRRDPEIGEHFVVFFPDVIEKLWIRWNELGYTNNLNKQHDPKQVVSTKDAFLVEQWIVRDGIGVPPSLKEQNIQNGSLMGTYQIRNQQYWKEIQDGKYNGFSIEGMFLKVPITIDKQQMKRVGLSQEELDERALWRFLQENNQNL